MTEEIPFFFFPSFFKISHKHNKNTQIKLWTHQHPELHIQLLLSQATLSDKTYGFPSVT